MKIVELSNYQIVTLTAAILGGNIEHIDGEDIAIKVDELAPGKFNWKKHPNRIDLVTVRIALDDAKKEKNGRLLVGNHVRGWMVTANGLRYIVALYQNNLLENNFLKEVITKVFEYLTTEKERLLLTKAYDKYLDGETTKISKNEFFEFTRTNEYFKEKAKERRYTIIEESVINHQDLEATWEYLKENFLKENKE